VKGIALTALKAARPATRATVGDMARAAQRGDTANDRDKCKAENKTGCPYPSDKTQNLYLSIHC
jgi:hypothetical protein